MGVQGTGINLPMLPYAYIAKMNLEERKSNAAIYPLGD